MKPDEQEVNIDGLAHALAEGRAVVFPTDTVPALATTPEAAAQLWDLKRRPALKPVILMARRAAELWPLLELPIEAEWERMAAHHWPGALTLVLPARGKVVEALHPGGNSLGIRIPRLGSALELLEQTGPLATTSANRSGEAPCRDPDEAVERFPGVPLLDRRYWGGASGKASTVVAWQNQRWHLLRQGPVVPNQAMEAPSP